MVRQTAAKVWRNQVKNEAMTRVVSAVIMLAVYLVLVLYPGIYYFQLYLAGIAIVYLGMSEYYHLTRKYSPFENAGHLAGFLVVTSFFIDMLYNVFPELQLIWFNKYFPFIISAYPLVAFLLFMVMIYVYSKSFNRGNFEGLLVSAAVTLFGLIYLAVPVSHFLKILTLPDRNYFILFFSVVTMMTDTGAYIAGKLMGKHKVGWSVSPNKTWEGYIGGFGFAVLSSLLLNYIWLSVTQLQAPFGTVETVFVSALLSLVAVAGDLTESAIKRDAGMKDSSNLIPGHGGILDRIDSLLFTVPFLYYYMQIREIMIRLF